MIAELEDIMDQEDFNKDFGHLGKCNNVDKSSVTGVLLHVTRLRQLRKDKKATEEYLKQVDDPKTAATKVLGTDGMENISLCMNHFNPVRKMVSTLERLISYGGITGQGPAGLLRRVSDRDIREEDKKLNAQRKKDKEYVQQTFNRWRPFRNEDESVPKQVTTRTVEVPGEVTEIGHMDEIPDPFSTPTRTTFVAPAPVEQVGGNEQQPIQNEGLPIAPKRRGWKKDK